MTDYISNADEPILAPAGEPLDADTLQTLLDRQVTPEKSERKRLASITYDIYRNRFFEHVLRAIRHQQQSKELRDGMRRLMTSVRNDAADVTQQLAVVWKNGATRHLGGDGDESDTARTEQEDALRALALECALDAHAPIINQLAWLQGPQWAVPMVRGQGRRKKLTMDVVGPHIYDVVQDIDNPLGKPVGLAWHLSRRRYAIGNGAGEEWSTHVLDAENLYHFKSRNGKHSLVGPPLRHGLGELPAACLRFTIPLAGDDWTLVDSQSRLVNGTIDVGVKLARMGLVRLAQCHKLLTVVGNLEGMPSGQNKSDPEGSVAVDTGNRGGSASVSIDVKDYDTSPRNFIHEVLFHALSMVEPYGGHIQVDSGQPDIYGRIVVPPNIQSEHRKAQVGPAKQFEADFWAGAVSMMRAEKHRLRTKLPGPDEVRDQLRVNFGSLTRDLEDPEKETKYQDWRLSRGQTSEVQLMRKQLGGASKDEAWREIQRNMDERKEFNDLARQSNLATNTEGKAMTAPEANGAMGTPVREAVRAAQQAAQGEATTPSGGSEPEPT